MERILLEQGESGLAKERRGRNLSNKKNINENGNPPPDYIVVESKYNTSQLNTLSDGTKQMSEKWIRDRLPDGVDKYADIDRYISRVMPDGSVIITKLD